MVKCSLLTYPKRFLKSDNLFKSYDQISINTSVLRNSVQYLYSACILCLYSLDCPFITRSFLQGITSNFQPWSVKKELTGITSSIYLNWNISVIHYRIDIKLILVKAEWQWLLFCKKNVLRHFRSRIHNVIKLSIADISLIFRQIETQIGQRDLGSTCAFEVI